MLGVSIVENTWNCVALKAVLNHKIKKTVLFVLLSSLPAIHNLICSFTSKQLRVVIKRLFSFNQLQTGEEQYHR